jgi:uncharacterized protein DUF6266
MGTFNKGILGGFSGTVGTVIGGSWKGIEYMRSQPNKKSGSSSQKQLQQQAKFAQVVAFESTMTGLLETSFRDYAIKMSGYNSAVSYNIKNAISGTYPNYSVDYSLALISRGDLPNATAPAATVTGGTVFFTWTDNSGVAQAQADDAAILVVYCPTLKTTLYTLNGGTRSGGAGNINAAMFTGDTVQTWLGFISADGKRIATSFYTGELTV